MFFERELYPDLVQLLFWEYSRRWVTITPPERLAADIITKAGK